MLIPVPAEAQLVGKVKLYLYITIYKTGYKGEVYLLPECKDYIDKFKTSENFRRVCEVCNM